MWYLSPD
jgi:magnesium-transporting ATPase (P-type)